MEIICGHDRSAAAATAAENPSTPVNETIALTIPKGTAVQVVLDKELKIRKVGQQVHGRVAEALEYGIVNYIYPPEELTARVEEYATNLLNGATRAIGLIKQAVVQGTEVHLDAGFFMERELQNRLFTSEDAQEGLASFIEKRQPQFKGK